LFYFFFLFLFFFDKEKKFYIVEENKGMLRGSTEGSLRAVLSPNLRGSHLPCAFLVALQVLLLLSPSLGLAARLHPFVEDCQFNVPPVPLPAELTGPAFVSHVRALNPDSMHLHSEYLVNFTRRSDNVFFSVAVPSVFRVTVAQDLTADIDLRLYMRNDTLHPIAVCFFISLSDFFFFFFFFFFLFLFSFFFLEYSFFIYFFSVSFVALFVDVLYGRNY
jgi:hypothetical protein